MSARIPRRPASLPTNKECLSLVECRDFSYNLYNRLWWPCGLDNEYLPVSYRNFVVTFKNIYLLFSETFRWLFKQVIMSEYLYVLLNLLVSRFPVFRFHYVWVPGFDMKAEWCSKLVYVFFVQQNSLSMAIADVCRLLLNVLRLIAGRASIALITFYTKITHSESNIASNITHFNVFWWHCMLLSEERECYGNILCYCNITHLNTQWVYNLINKILHDTTYMLFPTIKIVI
jgi:hypothetical protein